MKKIIILILTLNLQGIVLAQDYHYSMYDAAPLFLNPSLTGVLDGKWRVHGQYRTQWKAVNFKPYQNALLSFDMPVKKWGFGAQIMNARAGIGNYNALQGVVSVAYTVPINKTKTHNLTMGVQGGIAQKSVEYQLHTFDNQYVTTNGGGFNNSLPNYENFPSQSFISPVVNAGIMYYYAGQQSKLNPFIGISSFNLLKQKESFLAADDNNIPMRHYVHAGVRINFGELFYILPKALIMNQGTANEQTFAMDASIFFKSAEWYLLPGVVYRNKDAAIFSIGIKKENYIAKIAYDFNVSSLTPASNGRGGFEISLTYTHKKTPSKDQKICPRL